MTLWGPKGGPRLAARGRQAPPGCAEAPFWSQSAAAGYESRRESNRNRSPTRQFNTMICHSSGADPPYLAEREDVTDNSCRYSDLILDRVVAGRYRRQRHSARRRTDKRSTEERSRRAGDTMTDENLRALMQRSARHTTASDRLYAELLERRPRGALGRRGWIVVAAALAACAALIAIFALRPVTPPAPAGPAEASGVVNGRLLVVGGPAPGSARPLAGNIIVHRGTATDGPVVASAPTGTDGRFSVEVPPGTYELTGASPLVNGGRTSSCLSDPVTVTHSASTADVAVMCNIK